MTANKVEQMFVDEVDRELRLSKGLNKTDKKHYIKTVAQQSIEGIKQKVGKINKLIDAGFY